MTMTMNPALDLATSTATDTHKLRCSAALLSAGTGLCSKADVERLYAEVCLD